jgi:hypothetical protein
MRQQQRVAQLRSQVGKLAHWTKFDYLCGRRVLRLV